MINGISNTLSNQSAAVQNKTSLGKDDFMKLLISQLKNQDPLNPLEGTEFATQLAQFSSLEQLSNLNDAVNKSIDANFVLTQSINNTMSATLIGKQVKLTGDSFAFKGQQEISFGYNLPVDASSVKINVYDETGSLIKTIDGDTGQGDNKVSWDFYDNDGNKVPEGKYTFKVVAENLNRQPITIDSYMIGTINSVKFTENGTKLIVDGTEFLLSDVVEILNSITNGG